MNNTDMKLQDLYKQYLKSKEHVWTAATLRSESYRLSRYLPTLNEVLAGSDGVRVERMWAQVKHLAPYTRATVWIRITKFYDWLLKENQVSGANVFEVFKTENSQLFRNVYERTIPDISFEEAVRRVNSIQNSDDRERSEELLRAGLRLSDTRIDSERIKGKGGKIRRSYYKGTNNRRRSETSIRRALARVGLKPHDLRKIAACELARNGASAFALTKIFGWSNINTAQSYISATDTECADLMSKLK